MELKDKVVLITGATRGIGKSIAEVCAREGAKVIVTGIEVEEGKAVVDQLEGGSKKHFWHFLDVTHHRDRIKVFDFIHREIGRLDGLVNNAGLDFSKAFLDTSWDEWRKILAVDLDAVFALSQLAIEWYKAHGGGKIVNISSIHTKATYAGSGPYAAAKGAINMFTKSLCCEFAKDNIQVNAIAPGLVNTDIWQAHIDMHGSEEKALNYWKKNIPSGKVIAPREVGEMASFLLSDRCPNMNGSIIYLDGGLTSQVIASE